MVYGVVLLIILAVFWPIRSDNAFNRLDITDKGMINSGRKIYFAHCASCHGVNLEGQADWTKRGANGLYPAPPQNDSGHAWRHSDQYLINAVKNGLFERGKPTNMPAFDETLDDNEIEAVLTYIKSEWSAEKRAIQRKVEDSIPANALYHAN